MPLRYQSKPSVYLIAEIGINHNGSLDQARTLIEKSVEAGADAIKFQVRDLESVYCSKILNDSSSAEQGTQYLLSELRRSHLTFDQLARLVEFSRQFDVDQIATPFDLKSAAFLRDLGIPVFKIGSPDLTNLPLIEAVVGFHKPIILSTGMCEESEILQVVQYLKRLKADFSLLHCVSEYPASFDSIHLRYLPVLEALSGVRVGYSGHEAGYAPTLAAVALGASIVERHVTLDQDQSGPDHRSSLRPDEFAEMAQQIRIIERALGKPQKLFNQGERNNRVYLGKSLVAAQDLRAGTTLTASNLVSRSPAKGRSPLELDQFLGSVLVNDVARDEYIRFEDIGEPSFDSKNLEKPPGINRKWGIIGRVHDFSEFLDLKPQIVEIHLTWRDLTGDPKIKGRYPQDLVVHAPEYYLDTLVDFASQDPETINLSLEMLRQTIQFARDAEQSFIGQKDPRGPRVIIHPGGHFSSPSVTNKAEQYRILKRNLQAVDTSGVRLLLENMPPLPSYFGGRWHNTIFMDPAEVAQFTRETGIGLCFDVSHAQLYCNYIGISLRDFTRRVLDCISYLHLSDARGITEEGLQVGDGNVDFDELFAMLGAVDPGFVPEVWHGHLHKGLGFRKALHEIEECLARASSRVGCHPTPRDRSPQLGMHP